MQVEHELMRNALIWTEYIQGTYLFLRFRNLFGPITSKVNHSWVKKKPDGAVGVRPVHTLG